MITDGVLHPFRHLEGGHAMTHDEMQHGAGGAESDLLLVYRAHPVIRPGNDFTTRTSNHN